MWQLRKSLKKPKEQEIINGVAYRRKEIRQIISSDTAVHFEFLEEVVDVKSAIQERRDKIAELEQEIKELEEKYDTTT